MIYVYSIWFVISIINQFGNDKSYVTRWIRNNDKLGIIPIWTFFAPNPVDCDLVILKKEFDENMNPTTNWEEINIYDKKWYSFIWNPIKKIDKLLSDSVNDIRLILKHYIGIKKDVNDEVVDVAIKTSVGYINILNIIRNTKKSNKTKFYQFAIVETKGFIGNRESVNPLYLSSIHKI